MINDPGRINLRKASRAAIVSTGLYAIFVLGFDDDIVALFAAFASFAALVFCDFGGALHARAAVRRGARRGRGAGRARHHRLGAHVAGGGSDGGGRVSHRLGRLSRRLLRGERHDDHPRLRARGDGAWTRQPDHGPRLRLGARRGRRRDRGAGAVAGPRAHRHAEGRGRRRRGARGCAHGTDRRRRAQPSWRHRDSSTTPPVPCSGPPAPRRATRALVALVRELRLAVQFADELRPTPDAADRALDGAVAAALVVVSACLRAPTATVDVSALVQARAAHTEHLEGWVHHAMRGSPAGQPTAVIERFDAEFPGRALSLRVLAVSANAASFGGARLVGLDVAVDRAPADLTFLTSPAAGVAFGRRLLNHLTLDSVRCRAALRTALGLAVAVAIGKLFDIDHAFWVVLGTLSVLRSNAFGTGVTALQAVLGALIGFAVSTVVILAFGGNETLAWIGLPIAIFLAAYTPGAVHYVVGQASFTVFVVLLFNIIEPEGWHTGLVRVEDIALGVSISLVIGTVLWPRGARAAAVDTFGVMLRDGGVLLVAALHTLVENTSSLDVDAARRRAMASARSRHRRARGLHGRAQRRPDRPRGLGRAVEPVGHAAPRRRRHGAARARRPRGRV